MWQLDINTFMLLFLFIFVVTVSSSIAIIIPKIHHKRIVAFFNKFYPHLSVIRTDITPFGPKWYATRRYTTYRTIVTNGKKRHIMHVCTGNFGQVAIIEPEKFTTILAIHSK